MTVFDIPHVVIWFPTKKGTDCKTREFPTKTGAAGFADGLRAAGQPCVTRAQRTLRNGEREAAESGEDAADWRDAFRLTRGFWGDKQEVYASVVLNEIAKVREQIARHRTRVVYAEATA